MKVLVLESVSGLHERVESELFPEGFAILRALTGEFSEAGIETVSTINNNAGQEYEKWLRADELFNHDEINRAVESDPDAALVVAPETNGELRRITERLEREEIPVLGPGGNSIGVSGDKWSTYGRLREKIPQPKTWFRPPNLEGPMVSKPRFGVGSEGVRIESSPSENKRNKIFQEYIEGEHLSSCLLLGEDEGVVLSLNRQIMRSQKGEISYSGNVIPFEGPNSERVECGKLALEAAESLEMRGFCGVDLVLSETPYFIEANPRVTTSFVGLTRIAQKNLGELLIETLLEGEKIERPELEGVSILKIPELRRKTDIDVKSLEELEDIPEIFAPPFPHRGCLESGDELFVSVGHGSSREEAEKSLEEGIEKALRVLEVDKDDIAWP